MDDESDSEESILPDNRVDYLTQIKDCAESEYTKLLERVRDLAYDSNLDDSQLSLSFKLYSVFEFIEKWKELVSEDKEIIRLASKGSLELESSKKPVLHLVTRYFNKTKKELELFDCNEQKACESSSSDGNHNQ